MYIVLDHFYRNVCPSRFLLTNSAFYIFSKIKKPRPYRFMVNSLVPETVEHPKKSALDVASGVAWPEGARRIKARLLGKSYTSGTSKATL